LPAPASKIVEDSEQDDLATITLSYMMYPARELQQPQRQSGTPQGAKTELRCEAKPAFDELESRA
jgi:hypothetical protein